MLLLISLSFGLLAFTAESKGIKDTDIYKYQSLYAFLVDKDFSEISFKNLLFDLINYLLANYITPNPRFVGLFWITIAYFFMLVSIVKIVRNCFGPLSKWMFLILVAALVIMPFVWISELVKQSVTFSIFAYALSIKLSGEKGAFWYLLVAVMLHISVLIIFPVYFFNNYYIKKFIVPIFIFCVFLSFFNILELLVPLAEVGIFKKLGLSGRITEYIGGYGMIISKRFIFSFVFFVLQVSFLVIINFRNLRNDNYLVLCVLAAGILFMNMGNSHNFVRLTYIYYTFYIFALLFFLMNSQISNNRLLILIVVLAFYAYSNLTLTIKFVTSTAYSNHYMDNDLLRLLFSNVIKYLKYSSGIA